MVGFHPKSGFNEQKMRISTTALPFLNGLHQQQPEVGHRTCIWIEPRMGTWRFTKSKPAGLAWIFGYGGAETHETHVPGLATYLSIYLYIYICMYVCMYVYIYIERERDMDILT